MQFNTSCSIDWRDCSMSRWTIGANQRLWKGCRAAFRERAFLTMISFPTFLLTIVYSTGGRSLTTRTPGLSRTPSERITVEARLSLGLAREVIAESPKAILSLAKTTATFAKYQYKEWRNPRIRYNVYHLPDEILADIVEFAIASESLESQPLAAVPLSHVSQTLSRRRSRPSQTLDDHIYRYKLEAVQGGAEAQQEATIGHPLQVPRPLLSVSSISPVTIRHVGNRSLSSSESVLMSTACPSFEASARSTCRISKGSLSSTASPRIQRYKTVENNIHCYGKLRCPKLTRLEFVNVVPKSLPRNARFTITKPLARLRLVLELPIRRCEGALVELG